MNTLIQVAESVNLKMTRFQKDIGNRRLLARLAKDHAFAVETLGVFGTPTLVFPEEQAVFLRILPPPPEECLSAFMELRQLTEQRRYVREIKRPQRPKSEH